MSKLGSLAEACIIIVTPFVVISSIPYLGTTAKMFPDILHTPLMALVEFFSIYPAIVLLLVFSAAIFGQSATSVYYSAGRKHLTGQVLNEAEIRPGGILSIAGSISGRLMHGYLVASIASPTNRDKVFLFFDRESELGELHGQYSDEPFIVKWPVPEQAEGELKITVELHDVYPFKLFRTRKFSDLKAVWRGSAHIAERQKRTMEICSVSLPEANELRPFDSSRLPLAGWLCVTLRNDTGQEYNNCSGILRTDAGRFPLYAYEKVAQSITGDGKPDASFALQAGAETLLCANIIARTPRAHLRIDTGSYTVERELYMDPQPPGTTKSY